MFQTKFPLGTPGSWGRQRRGNGGAVGYSKWGKIHRNRRGDVVQEREKVCGRICITTSRTRERGRHRTGMVRRRRARESGRLWTWLNRRLCTHFRWSPQKFSRRWITTLAIGGAVFFDDPAGLRAESFEDLVVVAVLGELVVSLSPETGVNLGCDGSSPPLPPLVVLSLLPRRSPPRR